MSALVIGEALSDVVDVHPHSGSLASQLPQEFGVPPTVPLTQHWPSAILRERCVQTRLGNAMGEKQVVLAIFPNEAAADTAAQSLKEWDKLDDDVKLNAIGVLALDENGKVKTQKLGRRSWGKGAGIGVVLAALTPIGLLAGVIGGGLIGALHHKGLGIDSDERERLSAALNNGQAAVGALVNSSAAAGVLQKLTDLGGDTHVLSPSDEAVAEVDAVAPQVEAAEANEPKSP